MKSESFPSANKSQPLPELYNTNDLDVFGRKLPADARYALRFAIPNLIRFSLHFITFASEESKALRSIFQKGLGNVKTLELVGFESSLFDVLPSSVFSQLVALNLAHTRNTVRVLDVICCFPSLRTLDLSHCRILWHADAQHANLRRLTVSSVPPRDTFPNLEFLDVSSRNASFTEEDMVNVCDVAHVVLPLLSSERFHCLLFLIAASKGKLRYLQTPLPRGVPRERVDMALRMSKYNVTVSE